MAQKTGKEETDFKVVPPPAETITFNASSSASAPASTSTTSPAASSKHLTFGSEKSSPERKLSSSETAKRDKTESPSEITPPPAKRSVNRCSGCRRKVGLTGFRCRCGDLFCSEHRYSDRHDCGYDYKAAGREAIARENPVVKASNIVKI